MTNYPYTRNIPAGGNNPSTDRPNMTENYNSLDSLIAEDHYGFNVENGGFHQKIRMPDLVSIPGGRIDDSITAYSKLVNSVSQLFITNDTSGNEYQLTRMDPVNFTTFGLYPVVVYAPDSHTGNSGWTFLPGGLRLQYGLVNLPASFTATINYPISYSTIYSVVVNYVSNSTAGWQLSTFNSTGFTFIRDTASSGRTLSWTAIGI